MNNIVEEGSAGVCAVADEPIWETAQMSVAAVPNLAAGLRRQVMSFLNYSSPFSSEELADVEMAVGEACANALKHGSPRGELDEVRVKCMRNERTLIVEISDDGYGFDPDSVLPPTSDRLGEGGMGIFLMRTLMDSVEFEFGLGTTVRLVKHRRLSLLER